MQHNLPAPLSTLTRRTGLLSLLCVGILSACSLPLRREDTVYAGGPWQGKLSVRTMSTAPQSFSAEFELQGNADRGALLLLSPLGTSLARLSWAAGMALLERPAVADERFDSLEALARAALGADVPVRQVFDWLMGTPSPAPGWVVDLGGWDAGRILARQEDGSAELRIALER